MDTIFYIEIVDIYHNSSSIYSELLPIQVHTKTWKNYTRIRFKRKGKALQMKIMYKGPSQIIGSASYKERI